MREILFRGKTRKGEWVYGDLLQATEDKACLIVYMDNKYRCNYRDVFPETIGQFTGLTDKNGKKIFEGDIVKTKYGRLCVVEWRLTQCFCGVDLMVCNCDFNSITKPPSGWDLYLSENLEVIGNIHDNKLEDFENGC